MNQKEENQTLSEGFKASSQAKVLQQNSFPRL